MTFSEKVFYMKIDFVFPVFFISRFPCKSLSAQLQADQNDDSWPLAHVLLPLTFNRDHDPVVRPVHFFLCLFFDKASASSPHTHTHTHTTDLVESVKPLYYQNHESFVLCHTIMAAMLSDYCLNMCVAVWLKIIFIKYWHVRFLAYLSWSINAFLKFFIFSMTEVYIKLIQLIFNLWSFSFVFWSWTETKRSTLERNFVSIVRWEEG